MAPPRDASKRPPPAAMGSNTVGDYQLGDCIGKGAFGVVYQALNMRTGEVAAIKQISLSNIPKSELESMMTEIDLMKMLEHPNIVKYIGYVKTTANLNIMLEFCENGSLQSICKKFGRFPEPLMAMYTTQVLDGLIYLHNQGVIHRDIKGANILTTKDGHVKLADFGVATRMADNKDNAIVGSPYWMAPEVIELNGGTPASDIWSLGCTIIELLTGEPPYYDLVPMSALFRIVQDDHPPLPDGISGALRDFFAKCFCKDYNLRTSAVKLRRHVWLQSAPNADGAGADAEAAGKAARGAPAKPRVSDINEVVQKVIDYNSALQEAGTVRLARHASIRRARVADDRRADTFQLAMGKSAAAGIELDDGSDDGNWDADFEDVDVKPLKPSTPAAAPAVHAPMAGGPPRIIVRDPGTPMDGSTIGDGSGSFRRRSSVPLAGDDINDSDGDWDQYFEGDFDPSQQQRAIAATAVAAAAGRPVTDANAGRHRLKNFTEDDDDEDYSDLVESDEAFRDKIKRVGQRPPSVVPDMKPPPTAAPTKPQLQKMTQFREDDDEANDFSDLYGTTTFAATLHLRATSSANDGSGSAGGSPSMDAFDDDVADDDEEDPFAHVDEGFEDMDMQEGILRERNARLITDMTKLMTLIRPDKSDETIHFTVDSLLFKMREHDTLREEFLSDQRLAMLLDILQIGNRPTVLKSVLRVVNELIKDNLAVQYSLCVLGGIPAFLQYSLRATYAYDVRLEVGYFVKQICFNSRYTQQMFVSCGGVATLVDFLLEDYVTGRHLVFIGIDCIKCLLENHSILGSTSTGMMGRHQLCRLLASGGAANALASLLRPLGADRTPSGAVYIDRVADILTALVHQRDPVITQALSARVVLKALFRELSCFHAALLLKFMKIIRALSDANVLDGLERAGAIPELVRFLDRQNGPFVAEIRYQILATIFHLCWISKSRQEAAALAGAVPHLKQFASTNTSMRDLAMIVLCNMADAGERCRAILWSEGVLDFYLNVLQQRDHSYFQISALEAVTKWLEAETAQVEDVLVAPENIEKIVIGTSTPMVASLVERLLGKIEKLVRSSEKVSRALGQQERFVQSLVAKLEHRNVFIRTDSLKILLALRNTSLDPAALVATFADRLNNLRRNDPSVMVQNAAGKLLAGSAAAGKF